MALAQTEYKDREFLAVIGDEVGCLWHEVETGLESGQLARSLGA